MSGDDRVRFCTECQLNVYNFSALTHAEVEMVVAAREGRLCARFYHGFQAFQMKHISLPSKTPPHYQLKLGLLMGAIVEVPMNTQTTPISDRLSEPTNSTSTAFSMGVVQDNGNPIRKFFSRLRHHL